MAGLILANPWVQNIVGGFIVAGIIFLAKLLLRSMRLLEILLASAIGSIVLAFGQFLQPSVQYAIEGNNPFWSFFSWARDNRPLQFFFSTVVIGGLIPGTITGVIVVAARSLKQRLCRGAITGVLSLILVDVLSFAHASDFVHQEMAREVITWKIFISAF